MTTRTTEVAASPGKQKVIISWSIFRIVVRIPTVIRRPSNLRLYASCILIGFSNLHFFVAEDLRLSELS